jgi:hypothetical protein
VSVWSEKGGGRDVARTGEPDRDADWNWQARRETTTERLDRNWSELRVAHRVSMVGIVFLAIAIVTVAALIYDRH